MTYDIDVQMTIEAWKEAKNNIDTYTEQMKPLLARKKQAVEDEAECRTKILAMMQDSGVRQDKVASCILTVKECPPSCDIEDESAVPDKWMVISKRVDKVGIKKALKAGEKFNFAVLSEGKQSLEIRSFD